MKTYARFATAPIGAGLAALDGGLTVTTTVGSPNQYRAARSDIPQDAGVHGAEFSFWGDAALQGAIGVLQSAVALNNYVGGDAQSVGWLLDAGVIRAGGVTVASGLPIPAKGEMVGLRVDLDADTIEFYRGNAIVHTRALPQAGATWHFGVSMGSAVAGALACAVNAGQWIPNSPAAAAGWANDDTADIVLKVSDIDWLSATTDTPANARYEGLIGPDGLETYAAMHHWAWGGDPPMEGGNAQLDILDPDGLLDDAVAAGVRGARVAVQLAEPDYFWARFVSPDTSFSANLYLVSQFSRVRFIGANGFEVVKEFPATNVTTTFDVAADGLTAPMTVVFDQQPDSRYLMVGGNSLVGTLPPRFEPSTKLTHLYFYGNAFSGDFPSLVGLPSLQAVYCYANSFTGDLPDVSLQANLTILYAYNNQFTGWAGGSISATVQRIRVQNNLLTQAAVDALLAACVANGRTSAAGVCELLLNGTGNAAPSAAGYADRDTLVARGWTVGVN